MSKSPDLPYSFEKARQLRRQTFRHLWRYATHLFDPHLTTPREENNLFHLIPEDKNKKKNYNAIITGQHAGNAIPEKLKIKKIPGFTNSNFFETRDEAYDLGTRDIVYRLCKKLNAPGIVVNFTRLLADPNRDLKNTITPTIKEGFFEGNRTPILWKKERQRIFTRTRESIIEQVQKTKRKVKKSNNVKNTPPTIIWDIHSAHGKDRNFNIGVLYTKYKPSKEIAQQFVTILKNKNPHLLIKENYPYNPSDKNGPKVTNHALEEKEKTPVITIELNQDEIANNPDTQKRYADILIEGIESLYQDLNPKKKLSASSKTNSTKHFNYNIPKNSPQPTPHHI